MGAQHSRSGTCCQASSYCSSCYRPLDEGEQLTYGASVASLGEDAWDPSEGVPVPVQLSAEPSTPSRKKVRARGTLPPVEESMEETYGLRVLSNQDAELAKFNIKLQQHGIDTTSWGRRGGSNPAEQLYRETYESRMCVVVGLDKVGIVRRIVRCVRIFLLAEISGSDHCLISRIQFRRDGSVNEEKRSPTRQLVFSKLAMKDDSQSPAAYEEENYVDVENWREASTVLLQEWFGLPAEWQEANLVEEDQKFEKQHQPMCETYPGLVTINCIHVITLRIKELDDPVLQTIGLPSGSEFATTDALSSSSSRWEERVSNVPSIRSCPQACGLATAALHMALWSWVRYVGVDDGGHVMAPASTNYNSGEEDVSSIKRVPLPSTCVKALATMQARLSGDAEGQGRAPNAALWAALEDRSTDWAKARRMAKRMADPKYTLRQFHCDLEAFPELNLYLLENLAQGQGNRCASGRTLGDEYQRTLGAFFAIFWLVRLQVDGKDGFTFGVDDKWNPIRLDRDIDESGVASPLRKRLMFFRDSKWNYFRQLLLSAGVLKKQKGCMGKTSVDERRLLSLLALTAIHDIMKISVFLPRVQEEHAPYHGYAAGDTITDHDHALSYIMEHFPDALPSFKGLDPQEQRAIHFTQCDLCFNHGWLVQAEAPPGATFTRFREVLLRDKGALSKRDIAFYFVHWLTDLAGAEPTPLGGCEKFVLKFPVEVLNSFLRSFEFVERLTTKTETEALEEYLKVRWCEQVPPKGPVPTGSTAVARMRLLCMAQAKANAILQAFDSLPDEDRDLLSWEMACTGCSGQSYSKSVCPETLHSSPQGPAFLVYYGPALLQSLGKENAVGRLQILAEIYRQARALWPASEAQVAVNVIVRIDVIKSMSLGALLEACRTGDMWLLVKRNDLEGIVERSSVDKAATAFVADRDNVRMLDMQRLQILPSLSSAKLASPS